MSVLTTATTALRRRLNYGLLGHLLEIRAHAKPDFPVLVFEDGRNPEEVQTYRDLFENSHRMARALVDSGVEVSMWSIFAVRPGIWRSRAASMRSAS